MASNIRMMQICAAVMKADDYMITILDKFGLMDWANDVRSVGSTGCVTGYITSKLMKSVLVRVFTNHQSNCNKYMFLKKNQDDSGA